MGSVRTAEPLTSFHSLPLHLFFIISHPPLSCSQALACAPLSRLHSPRLLSTKQSVAAIMLSISDKQIAFILPPKLALAGQHSPIVWLESYWHCVCCNLESVFLVSRWDGRPRVRSLPGECRYLRYPRSHSSICLLQLCPCPHNRIGDHQLSNPRQHLGTQIRSGLHCP